MTARAVQDWPSIPRDLYGRATTGIESLRALAVFAEGPDERADAVVALVELAALATGRWIRGMGRSPGDYAKGLRDFAAEPIRVLHRIVDPNEIAMPSERAASRRALDALALMLRPRLYPHAQA